jgi:hypothetical protein
MHSEVQFEMDKAIFKKFIEKLSEKIDFGTRREHIRSNPD